MNSGQIIEETKKKLDAAVEHLKQELQKLRTGRAHPSMLDGVSVEAYGQTMPIKAVAGITAPEAQMLQITPFDPANLQAIAEGIRKAEGLGLTPVDDGRVIRINMPPLTTETRTAMTKTLGQKIEDYHITSRQIRHEAFRQGEQAEKDKQMSKDERLRFEKQIDELITARRGEVETLFKAKEQEILTI